MKRIAFVFCLITVITGTSFAQDYKSAIGGRLGTTYYDLLSFSYKTFITPQGAIEFNAGFGAKHYDHDYQTFTPSIAGTYQHHFDIKPVDGLKWYIGGGLVMYNTFADDKHDEHGDYDGFGLGIYPTGGVDYTFSNIPLNLSADVRPTINLTGPSYYNSFYGNFGIAARYTIGR